MEIDYLALQKTAEKDATRKAPPPRYDPFEAAIAVFAVAYVVFLIFALLLGLEVGSFHIQRAVGIASMLAGGATFFLLWRQKRQHRHAVDAR